MTTVGEITLLLRELDDGREGAMDRLMERVYTDLRQVASKHLHQHFGAGLPGVTLEPSALVNETFLKLIKQRGKYDNRGQFFSIATKLMLRVLMDYHRARGASKRGGDQVRVTLTGVAPAADQVVDSAVPDLKRAMEELERLDPRKAEVVSLRVLWGLTNNEVAEALGISLATVERDWAFARAWLAARLSGGSEEAETVV